MKASPKLRRLLCLILCFVMVVQPMTGLAAAADAAELIVNGTFADADGDSKADDWTYWFGTVAECPSTIGEDGLTITADSSTETQRLTVHQTASLVAGKTYRLTLRYQVTSTARGSLEIRHNGTGAMQRVAYHTSKTDGWQTVEHEFVATGNMKLEIVISQGATLTCSVDDVSLVEVVEEEPEAPETENLLVNGTYADGDGDSKADSWNYWNGSNAAAASSCNEDGLSITADSSGTAQRLTVHQTVTGLDASKTYRFTGEYNILSTGKGAFEIGYTPNATGSRINTVKLYAKTDGWQSFDVTFTGCESVKIESAVSSGATMTVKINNFSLTEVVEEEPEDDGNLVENPTYVTEDITKIPSWNYYPAYDTSKYTSSVEDGVFTGTVLNQRNLVLHQTMPLTAEQLGKTYTFTGDIKTEGLGSYAMFKVYIQDANAKQLSSFLSPQIKGDTDWTTLTIEFEVPEKIGGVDVASIKLEQYILKGNGTAHFRNPKIIKTGDFIALPEGDPVDTLLKNGGYETTLAGFPASWNLWQSTGGLNAVSDREVFKEGYSSVHLSNVTEGKDSRGSVHQTFTITNDLQELWGQSVKIGQWVKTKDFVGDALMFRVHYATVSGAFIAKSMPVKSTQDWTYYEYIIDLPDHFETIKVETLYEYAQGDVWIDNTTCYGYIKATGLDVNTDKLVMKAGETFQLEVGYVPANTTVKEVTYTSSNEAVMTVSDSGLVSAVADGYATITITHADGMKKEIAVLVADETTQYTEDLEIFTQQNVNVIDVLPEGWDYTVTAAPQYGTFLVINDAYYYYPAKDFYGEDSVTLLTENESGKALVIVPLFVEQVNAAPVFDNLNVLTYENNPVSGKVSAVDPENDAIVYGMGTPCEHGTMTLEGNVYTYTPDEGFNGYDYITFTADDGNGNVTERVTTIYVAPDTQELLDTVKTEHSRLLADNVRFEQLKALLLTDENVKEWFAEVKATIDPLLDDPTPVPYHCPDDVRLDTQGSKDVLNLAFMYRMTGEQVYLDRAWVEMEALCGVGEYAYPDWHPSHLLDTAMTANGVAIAYDWLYDYLTAEQKEICEKALYDYGLEEALYQFSINSMFVTNLNNWNYVCNGGFITTAMAMAHHENELYNSAAGEVLQKCYQSVQWGLPQYAPEGDSIEGISYWDYGTRYLASMLASISSATNIPNPFLSAPGLDMTALYPIYMSGKAGTYNYSDNDMTDAVGYLNLWFAEVYGEPSWTWYHKYYMENDAYAATVYDLLYYNADYYESKAPEQLDAFYTSQAVTTMRSDFTDPNGSFLGFKGGLNGAAHGDIDIGSFVFDMFGERWAFDFGKEDYNLVGYWEIAEGGTRWNYYRKNALGHNTLVINPTTGANQKVGAYAGVIDQSINNPGGGYTILDMTDAYIDNAVSVQRGYAYFDREQVLIRDEYTLKAPGTTYWQMHTKADVSISEDGKTATLTLNGKTLLVKLFDENGSDLKFATMAAKPYDAEPTEGENVNEGVTKLYIKADGVQTGVFNVLLTPADKADPEIKALENWNEYAFGDNMHDHTPELLPAHDPSCTEPGMTEGQKCAECGEILVAQKEIPATGHATENGTCTVCGEYVGPQIISQPADYVGMVGDTAGFTVVAEGEGLTYQWYYSNNSGETWSVSGSDGFDASEFHPILRDYRDGYKYYCQITDVFGNTVNSNVVSMDVKASEVTITEQPDDINDGLINALHNFKVTATGENLDYRWEYSDDGGTTWQLSWNEGYNTDTLTVRLYAYRDGYLYRCKITSGLKVEEYTDAVELNLQASSVAIVTQPASVVVLAGENIQFHVEATGMNLTYEWYRSNDNGATWIRTYLSGYNTDTLAFVANNARAALYKCRIVDGSGQVLWTDIVKMEISSTELKILMQPESITCASGATAEFHVEAQGDNLRYQWYASSDGGETWTLTYLGGSTTDTLSFVVTASRAARLYKCVVTDIGGNTVETNAVSVTIG